MASAFTHIAAPLTMRWIHGSEKIGLRLLWLGMFLSVAPDLDVVAFKFGIPYASPWGHRGFTHSIAFSFMVSLMLLVAADYFQTTRRRLFGFCFISLLSHALLDMLTNGGLGVALFWPLTSERYFFPWRGIQVSPIGVKNFFSLRGLKVLASELVFVWLPCLCLIGSIRLLRRQKN
jgi:inner membrane protein